MVALEDIKTQIQQQGKFWISFVGSSTTSCEWVHPNWREIVEYVVKQEVTKLFGDDWKTPSWKIRTFNNGYDGATTKDIVEKLPDILLVHPDLVIGMIGGNDPLFNIDIATHLENIKTILDTVTQSGVKIVWSTSQGAGKGSHKITQMKPYADAVMQTFHNSDNMQMVDMYSRYLQFPSEKIFTFRSEAIPLENVKEGDPDLIHPNQLGNAYIAKVFLEEVFGIAFDPEKYMETTLAGEKYPQY